jgi:hypothetical protein
MMISQSSTSSSVELSLDEDDEDPEESSSSDELESSEDDEDDELESSEALIGVFSLSITDSAFLEDSKGSNGLSPSLQRGGEKSLGGGDSGSELSSECETLHDKSEGRGLIQSPIGVISSSTTSGISKSNGFPSFFIELGEKSADRLSLTGTK